MSKITSHEPFGHLQPKLWAKEGLGVWLPTTKSRELTSSWCLQQECDMALESSQQELQLCFKPRPNPSLGREVMNAQSPGSPNQDSFGTPLWESWEKEPFGCSLQTELQGEPLARREATAPSIIRKVHKVHRREEVPPNGGTVLPENVHMQPFLSES